MSEICLLHREKSGKKCFFTANGKICLFKFQSFFLCLSVSSDGTEFLVRTLTRKFVWRLSIKWMSLLLFAFLYSPKWMAQSDGNVTLYKMQSRANLCTVGNQIHCIDLVIFRKQSVKAVKIKIYPYTSS